LPLTGLAAMAVTEALSLSYTWWADPISKAIGLSGGGPQLFSQGKFSSVIFASHGITPLGYAAFAFALGTAAGVLTRRALPAMAITLAIFAAVQVPMPLAIRPHLVSPSHTTDPIAAADEVYGSLTPAGGPSPPGSLGEKGATSALTPAQCMKKRAYREATSSVPPSRYWSLQWT